MGVYKIPAGVIDDIHAKMSRFWWGQEQDKKRVHWKSWKDLCTLKCLGGMGFRDLKVFNDALLGRQAWWLTCNQDSLLNKVLSAKYYEGKRFVDAHLGVGGSYSWRSIWSLKALFKEGLIWRIGNGSSVDIWSKPWVDNGDNHFISTPITDEVRVLSDLIDHNSCEWDVQCIESIFNDRVFVSV
ncbi:uncharacterized protein LOC110734358 [Chenopodium quinoa]|uniref:uncharacterized protein LOC110734358 n=1 Tax=Chenopodium quinoa TaxID=63459 RepID=UPI000B778BA9|nr:uncharacterized protein LOC110734358 [Chenopodium quinoa]